MVLISLKARLTCSSSVQPSHRMPQLRRDRKATAKISGCLLFLSALILNAWCFQEATLVGSSLQGELLRGLLLLLLLLPFRVHIFIKISQHSPAPQGQTEPVCWVTTWWMLPLCCRVLLWISKRVTMCWTSVQHREAKRWLYYSPMPFVRALYSLC